MARTMLIGLRREPQPPMPIVIPSRSSATTSASVISLSVICSAPGPADAATAPLGERGVGPSDRTPRSLAHVRVALGHERIPVLVGHPREVQLEREALLVAVRTL